MILDPGITFYAHVAVAATSQLVTSGIAQVTYSPSAGGEGVTVEAPLRIVHVGEDTYSLSVRIPTATALPGYPVDPSVALAVPSVPTQYVRTIRIDGVLVQTETLTLAPEDVRASVATTSVTISADWFTRGDLNSDGTTDLADWAIVIGNWQLEWRDRLIDLVAMQNVLANLNAAQGRPAAAPSTDP